MEKKNHYAIIGLVWLSLVGMLCIRFYAKPKDPIVYQDATIEFGLEETETSLGKQEIKKPILVEVATWPGQAEEVTAQGEAETEEEVEMSSHIAIVATKAVNVRAKAKKDAKVIAILERGARVEWLDSSEDGWARIRYEGKEGFVYETYITSEDAIKMTP